LLRLVAGVAVNLADSPGRRILVAVGTTVARRPPHRPVLALLTHTVPTSDVGVLGVEARIRIGL
jgi:hypothetical protein